MLADLGHGRIYLVGCWPVAETAQQNDQLRSGMLLRTMLNVLADADQPLPARDVFARVRQQVGFTDREESRNHSGQVRAENYFYYRSSGLRSLDIVDKSPTGWRITDAGRHFLRQHENEDLERVDAKYKAEKPEGFPGADVYQLLAYCTAYGLRRGHLVYAAGNDAPPVYRITGAGVEVAAHTLDLTASPVALLARVDNLAVTVAEAARSEGTQLVIGGP